MTHTITLIPGDGIGPEVTGSVVRILEAAGVDIRWERFDAGVPALKEYGTPLPQPLLASIARNKQRNAVAIDFMGSPLGLRRV